jgi:hypothetical protein
MADRRVSRSFVSVGVVGEDRHRFWTASSAAILIGAAALAVLGGSPVDLPMPTHVIGWVTPTCGLTRGSTAIVRGDLALGWSYNPASFLVAATVAVGLGRAVTGCLTGRWITLQARLAPKAVALTSVVAIGLLAVLWVHQQANADFIINSRR